MTCAQVTLGALSGNVNPTVAKLGRASCSARDSSPKTHARRKSSRWRVRNFLQVSNWAKSTISRA
jgi:hypothetical protein